jgi:presenilin-like A22 family membrane protease
MRVQLYAWLFVFFVLSQALGTMVALTLIQQGVQVSIINDNPQDPVNAIALILYILFATGMFLLIIRFFKKRAVGFFEKIAVFSTTWIVGDAVLYQASVPAYELIPWFGLALAFLITALRLIFAKNIWLKNLASLFAVAGAGSLIGVSLGIWPVLLFISLLSVYDLIAVFVTKHMVTMAKAIVSQNLAFTFTIPTKEHEFQLGTGDLVIPLVFGIAVFSTAAPKMAPIPFYAAFLPVSMIMFASVLGLIATLHICAERKIALPALPLQTAYMIAMWGACLFAGMPVL